MTRKDGGLYTIKCENGEGVNETTVKLDVYCKTLQVKNASTYQSNTCSILNHCHRINVHSPAVAKDSLDAIFGRVYHFRFHTLKTCLLRMHLTTRFNFFNFFFMLIFDLKLLSYSFSILPCVLAC